MSQNNYPTRQAEAQEALTVAPKSVEAEKEIRAAIKGVSANLGGTRLTALLTFLLMMSACGGDNSPASVGNIPELPQRAASKNPGINPSNSTERTEVTTGSPSPETLRPGEAIIDALTPRDGYYKVIGRIGQAEEGSTASVKGLLHMPDGSIKEVTVDLKAQEFDAEGRLNIDPKTVKGSKLHVNGKEFSL